MANIDIIKPSYDALNSMSETIRAFADLVDLIPEEDELSSLWRILTNQMQADILALRGEVGHLWNLIPDNEISSL